MTEARFVDDRARYRADVERLLRLADDEFVPPLTGGARGDIARAEGEGHGRTIADYVAGCLRRPLLLAVDDDDCVIGMCSVEPIDEAEPLANYTPTNHVDIIVVDPEARGEGVATAMYERLISDAPPSVRRPYVSTKTWSTNHGHLTILDRLDFDLVTRVPDDRGDGIDTVYYARSV